MSSFFVPLTIELFKLGIVYHSLNGLKNHLLGIQKINTSQKKSTFLKFHQIFIHEPLTEKQVFQFVVLRPLCEEIFFRLCVQGSIFLIQRKGKFFQKKDEGINQQRAKIIRISITAFLFGCCHFIRQPRTMNQFKQVVWLSFTSFLYGYLSENCRSLCECYFLHGLNNALGCGISIYPEKKLMLNKIVYIMHLSLALLLSKKYMNIFLPRSLDFSIL